MDKTPLIEVSTAPVDIGYENGPVVVADKPAGVAPAPVPDRV